MNMTFTSVEHSTTDASKPSSEAKVLKTDGVDVKTFIENFHIVASTPRGLRMLRKLVFEVAVRGGLSVTLQTDDPPRRLLERAASDRLDRQSRGEARQMAELGAVTAEDAPFRLPEGRGWMWSRIGLAVNLVNGRAFKPKDWSASGLPIVRIQNLNSESASFNYCNFEVDPKHHLHPGDFLISWSGTPGTSFGAFIWNGPKGVLNQHIFRAEIYGDAYDLKFLRIAINARLDEMIAQAHGGVGLQHITKGKLEALAIPLPSRAEQSRIVARVDQLTALCDELEARQTTKRETGTRLTKSALEALTSAEGPEDFEASCNLVLDNFDVLIDNAEKLSDLRRSVVALALMGRLVSQDPDEVALSLPPSSDELFTDPAIQLPASWRWVPLGALVTEGPKNGYSPKGVEYQTDVKSLTLTATTSGHFDGRFFKYIDEEIPKGSGLWLRDGDVLVQRGNTIEYVGMAAIYRGPEHTFIYPDLMMKIRITQDVDLDFVHMAINGPIARAFIMSRASGTSGSMPKINQSTLMAIPIPLPPLKEQLRIMAQIARVESLYEAVATALSRAQDRASKLVEAMVRGLIA
jgi:type I restriction enzyme S subunit